MQKFGKTLITNAGRQMLTDVDGAKGKLTYTKASLYSQDVKTLKEADIIALTSLTGPQLATDLQVTDVKDNTVTVLASFNNAKVTQDLTFNSIGWFAKTSVDDKEQLLAITPSETEQTLVAGSNGASTSSIDVEMVFARSHDTTVVLNPSSVGLVSGAQMDGAINNARESIINGINQLSALVESSNTLDSQKINLDNFSKIGITKYTNCQLQSAGRIAGLNQDLTNYSGWIFNVPNKTGAATYQQLVYINDYGSGPLTYARSRTGGANQVEDFQKVLTDQDAANLFGMTQAGVKQALSHETVNPDQLVDTGIYRLSGCKLAVSAVGDNLNSLYWGWLINLNYENVPTSNAIYQILIVNEKILFRTISVQNNKYPPFDGLAYSSDIAQLQEVLDNAGQVKQITVNKGTPVSPDSNGVANITALLSDLETKVDAKSAHDTLAANITSARNSLSNDIKATHDSLSTDIKTARDGLSADIAKRVLTVNEKSPNSSGNVVLTDFDHPTQVFNGTTVNLNALTATGLYELRNATIQNSLSSLPGFTQLNATYAYLIAINNPPLNNTFQILICRQMQSFILDYRYINKTYNDYPNFKRIIDSSDYTNLFNKIDLVDKKELVHFCDDLDSGMAYSKTNPNVFVATP